MAGLLSARPALWPRRSLPSLLAAQPARCPARSAQPRYLPAGLGTPGWAVSSWLTLASSAARENDLART
jgi:hypothetical protein